MNKHKTKDGRTLLISVISNAHLLATMALCRRRATEGITVESGGRGFHHSEAWYDTEIITGRDALDKLNYDAYAKEAQRRNLI